MNSLLKLCAAGLLVAFICTLTGCNGASQIARDRLDKDGIHGFLTKTLHRGIWTRKYAVFIPQSYFPGTTRKYPVIIYLHGIGEGDGLGMGNLKNLTVGLAPEVAKRADTFDFIVIFPQSDGGWSPTSVYTQDMFTAWANTAREYPVDPYRAYLTGVSTGGHGTWDIAAKYPNHFAAIVPMASNGADAGDAAKLTNTPVRAFCSVFGDIFAWNNDQSMVNSIRSLNPKADALLIKTPTFGHDCWDNAYAGYDLFYWLKQQRRSETPVALAPPPAPAAKPAPVIASAKPASVAKPVTAPISVIKPAPVVSAPAPVSAAKPAPSPTPVVATQAPISTAKPAPSPTPVVVAPAPAPVTKPAAQPTTVVAAPAPRAMPTAPVALKPAASKNSGAWVNTPW